MRTTAGEQPVHVVYRRIDDEFLDPLHFRPDSVIGCAGLAQRRPGRHVTLANAIGNGVADDKLLYTYVPDLIRYYLGEEPLLANVETYRLDDPDVLDARPRPARRAGAQAGRRLRRQGHRDRPARRRRGAGRAARRGRGRPARLDRAAPGGAVDLAHAGRRPARARATSTCGRSRSTTATDVWVLPGGLTRVALPEGALVVNSSQGGGSKDTWVLADAAGAAPSSPRRCAGPRRAPPPAPSPDPGPAPRQLAATAATTAADGAPMLSRIAESLFWIGRYVERADDTARILDVHLHRMLGDPWVDEDAACRSLLRSWACRAASRAAVRRPGARRCSGSTPTTPARSSARWPPPGRTPAAPGRRSLARCGSASTSPGTRCRRPAPGRAARAYTRSSAACGSARGAGRARRVDDEPRRRLAVPGARPQPRAGRHDRPAAVHPRPGRRHASRLADRAAGLRRRRVVPAHPRRRVWTTGTRPSSCCWTGCSRARCSHALSTAEAVPGASWSPVDRAGRGRRPRPRRTDRPGPAPEPGVRDADDAARRPADDLRRAGSAPARRSTSAAVTAATSGRPRAGDAGRHEEVLRDGSWRLRIQHVTGFTLRAAGSPRPTTRPG